ncbi:YcdB/YcdC domain-containing protein [Clostridium paraputrificum]|uniref:YcdB/YcdC domain-containing protein n=1 Tax=Clostridium paraputrificum TaxID=29363 RepID=UPI003D326FD3
MNYKKKSIIFFAIIVVLAMGIFFSIYLYVGGGTKEVKAAKRFIGIVYSYDIVDKSENKDQISYKSLSKSDSSSLKETYSVTTRDFGIDIDSEFNVIGFSNNVSKVGSVNISENKARDLAEEYLSHIYKGKYGFKEIIKDESTEKSPYYSLVFTKYADGYPYYTDQIMVSINKNSGKMDGYSNSTSQGEPEKVKINKSQDEAEDIAIKAFSKLNKDAEIVENTYKAFAGDRDKVRTELCYIVTLKGIDADNKETKVKYFISTENGNVVNTVKDKISSAIGS